MHVAGRVIEFTFWEWMRDLRWRAIQALVDFGFDSKCPVNDQFCSLARSRLLFALLLRLLCLFSVSIAFQRVGRFFGVSGHDPFRLCVELVQVSVQSSSWIESGRINGKSGRDDS